MDGRTLHYESRDGGKAVGGGFVKVTHLRVPYAAEMMNEALNPLEYPFDYP